MHEALRQVEWERVLALPGTFGFVLLCGWMTNRLARRTAPAAPPRIEHVHTIDYQRSEISPQSDGTILALCCVAGCGAIVRIGRVGSGTQATLLEVYAGEGKCRS